MEEVCSADDQDEKEQQCSSETSKKSAKTVQCGVC